MIMTHMSACREEKDAEDDVASADGLRRPLTRRRAARAGRRLLGARWAARRAGRAAGGLRGVGPAAEVGRSRRVVVPDGEHDALGGELDLQHRVGADRDRRREPHLVGIEIGHN